MNLRDLFGFGAKFKKKTYSRTLTKSIPMLQPEHGFYEENVLERRQVQDCYPNEKNGGGSC